jgi:hypothetical protein
LALVYARNDGLHDPLDIGEEMGKAPPGPDKTSSLIKSRVNQCVRFLRAAA